MVFPLVLLIVGLLTYVLATNAKASEIGRLVFFVGLFWLVYLLLGHTIRL